jgi:hypothetical protein
MLTIAGALIVLTAFSLSEVSDWRVLCNYHLASIESSIETIMCPLCLILSDELSIDISDHMITDVVSDNDLFDFSELGEFHKDLLVEVFEVVHCLDQGFLGHVQTICEGHCGWRVVVQMRED